MTRDTLDIVTRQLRRDEAVRPHPYRDPRGYVTIGVGRNLTTTGLSPDEIAYLLDNDLASAEARCRVLCAGFDVLSAARQAVLVNMTVNLGGSGIAAFVHLWAALDAHDFAAAAEAMLASLWATQVGARAQRLAQQMRSGVEVAA